MYEKRRTTPTPSAKESHLWGYMELKNTELKKKFVGISLFVCGNVKLVQY